MSFANKVVLITGASSGIGWCLAEQLASQGAKVGLLARRVNKLEKLATQIQGSGGTACYVTGDVTNRDEIKVALGVLRDQLGPVDLLIANAGLAGPTYLDQSNIDHVENIVRVNLLGVIYSIEAVLPEMMERRTGHITAISSLASYKGLPGHSGYCAAKAGVNLYLEGLRIQLRGHKVAVTTVCPGFIDTRMVDRFRYTLPFLMSPEKAARKIIKALKRKAKVYNFPWQTTWLIQLLRWLPDWFVYQRVVKMIQQEPSAPKSQTRPEQITASD
ncbi:MAG: SDR family NAD(P)-dependent oxidoreductase [Gemmataceae bacterium]